MEYLDIVDENGVPTGKIAERTAAHKQGLRHRTSHVWILRERAGKVEVLLQKRSQNKDSFPGCYDISSAGHIPAGVDFIPSALRELKEELGCSVSENELIYCGQRRFSYDGVFHGKEFHDRQVSNVYALWLDRRPEDFVLQKEELEEVRWFEFESCLRLVEKNEIPHCIYLEELQMLLPEVRKYSGHAASDGGRKATAFAGCAGTEVFLYGKAGGDRRTAAARGHYPWQFAESFAVKKV